MFLQNCSLWRFSLPILGSVLLIAVAEARPWTSSDGKTVEAEFVEFSADGEGVVLDIRGRRFTVPLDRLSEADRAYLATLKPAGGAASGRAEEQADDQLDVADDDDLSADLREPRVWTARDGTTTRARLIRISAGTVLLRDDDRSHRVRFYDLSLADRRFLAKALTARGQGEQVPPIRPELIDLPVETPPPSSSEDGGITRQTVPQTVPEAPPEAVSGADAGSAEKEMAGKPADIVLPPSGFGSLDDDGPGEPIPAPARAAEPGDDIVLPPSGFGSAPEDEPAEASMPDSPEPFEGFGSDVVLPPSGFGSLQESTAGSADEFFGEEGNPPQAANVQIPQSTIGDDAMLPASGFGSAPAEIPQEQPQVASAPGPHDARPEAPKTSADTRNPGISQPRQQGGSQPFTPRPSPRFAPVQQPPAELTGAQWNLRFFGILLLSGGCLLFSTSYLWLIASAFQDGFRQGLRWLVPGTAIVLTMVDSNQSNTPLMTMMLGICLATGGCGLLLS